MNKNIWILLIVVVIIVVIYFIAKKNKTKEIPNAVQNLVQSTLGGNIISSGDGSNVSTTTTSGFSIGDKIYSKGITNTYKSANATSNNLDSFKSFQKDEFIGTYLAKDGIFTKVLIANPAHSVFVLSNQIYSK